MDSSLKLNSLWGRFSTTWGELPFLEKISFSKLKLPFGTFPIIDSKTEIDGLVEIVESIDNRMPQWCCILSLDFIKNFEIELIPDRVYCTISRFTFSFDFKSDQKEELFDTLDNGFQDFSGSVRFEVFTKVRLVFANLPPPANIFSLQSTSDDDGLIPVRFTTELLIGTDNSGINLQMEAGSKDSHEAIVSAMMQFPLLEQPDSPLQLFMDYASLTIGATDSDENLDLSFAIEIIGHLRFVFPDLPSEMQPIKKLLSFLPFLHDNLKDSLLNMNIPMSGSLSVKISTNGKIELELTIDQPAIVVDILSFLSVISSGRPEPQFGPGNGAFPFDCKIAFLFKKIFITIDAEGNFKIEFKVGIQIDDLSPPDISISLCRDGGEWNMALALDNFEIPIIFPLFPLSADDFGTDGLYHIADNETHPTAELAIQLMTDKINEEIKNLDKSDSGAKKTRLCAKVGLFKAIFTIREMLGWEDKNFEIFLETVVLYFEELTPVRSNNSAVQMCVGLTQETSVTVFTDLRFVLETLKLQIPFSDPQNMQIFGKAHFDGFEGPFAILNQLSFGAGVSASMLYFELDGAGSTIAFPDLGSPFLCGGGLTIGEFRIGIGYTTFTFACTIVGELELPERFVNELDTSDKTAVGIRLPQKSALNFRLDLLPIPIEKVILIFPYFSLDIDLKKNYSAGIVSAEKCIPYWDGLQFIVKDIVHKKELVHVDFKQFSFMPFFCCTKSFALKYDFDMMFGDSCNGFTTIVDNYVVVSPLISYDFEHLCFRFLQIPLFFDPATPFCDNFCSSFRIAGFQINFNLQRPMPKFSFFALFDLLALLNNATYKIDPNGDLANSLRISLNNAHIVLPDVVHRLFPLASQSIEKPVDITINLGTFISIVQVIIKLADPLFTKMYKQVSGKCTNALNSMQNTGTLSPLEDYVESAGDILRNLRNSITLDNDDVNQSIHNALSEFADINVIKKMVDEVIGALPPQLRKIRLAASFGPFEARATLLIISPQKAREEIQKRDANHTRHYRPSTSSSSNLWDEGLLNGLMNTSIQRPGGGSTTYDSNNQNSNLFAGQIFSTFNVNDFDSIEKCMPKGSKAEMVMIGANVEVFNKQRFYFLGCIDSEGHFGMVTSADSLSLNLTIAGVSVPITPQINTRLVLSGKAEKKGVVAQITAQFSMIWEPVLNVLSIAIGINAAQEAFAIASGKGDSPVAPYAASLKIDSPSVFKITAPATFRLFNSLSGSSLLILNGSIDITERYCVAKGQLKSGIEDVIIVELECSGAIGKSATEAFEFAGSGSIIIPSLSLQKLKASMRISPSVIELELKEFSIIRDESDQSILKQATFTNVTLNGLIDIKTETVMLKGKGTVVTLFGTIAGLLEISITNKGNVTVTISGDLEWQETTWVNASFTFSNDKLTVKGRSTITKQFASIFCRASIDFSFDYFGVMSTPKFTIKGDWLIGISSPISQGQFIPIASDHISISDGSLPVTLFSTDGIYLPWIDPEWFKISKIDFPDLSKIPKALFEVIVENIQAINLPNLKPDLWTKKMINEFKGLSSPHPLEKHEFVKNFDYQLKPGQTKLDDGSLEIPILFDQPKLTSNLTDIESFPTQIRMESCSNGNVIVSLYDKDSSQFLKIPLPLKKIAGFSFQLNWVDNHFCFEIGEQVTHKITPWAGENGTIWPTGVVNVTQKESKQFVFSPEAGYVVDHIVIDNTQLNIEDNSYTFNNVKNDTSIKVYFKKTQYLITCKAGLHGSIIGSNGLVISTNGVSKGVLVTTDDQPAFSFKPALGFLVDYLTVDNQTIAPQVPEVNRYTFKPVTMEHTIEVYFKPEYTITAIAGPNGSIYPHGLIHVRKRGSKTFKFKPFDGFIVDYFTVDDVFSSPDDAPDDASQPPPTKIFTFKNIKSSHFIKVYFKKITTLTIKLTVVDDGCVYCNDNGKRELLYNGTSYDVTSRQIDWGTSSTYIFEANKGKRIESVKIDGNCIINYDKEAVTRDSITLTNIINDHEIVVTFV